MTEQQNSFEKNVHNLMKLVGLLDIEVPICLTAGISIIAFPYAKSFEFSFVFSTRPPKEESLSSRFY